MRSWRAEPALKLADNLAEFSRFLPPELLSAAAQTSDLTASNVPGVPVPVWLAGAQVERMYPLVATIGAAINITMLTYNGVASVGVSTDDAAVDDRDELVRSLRHGFREVIGSPSGHRRQSADDLPQGLTPRVIHSLPASSSQSG